MNKDNAHLYLPLVQALVDGKTVQASVPPDWVDIDDMDLGREPSDYRIKPLSFPPKPDQFEWHNPDGLTAELVGDGYRLCVLGERMPSDYDYWDRNDPITAWKRGGIFEGECVPEFNGSSAIRVPLSTPYPDGSFVKDGKLVRPWKLTRELPGFRPLRDGEEYHRQDWTEEMLPEGWRPLLKGERVVDGARNDEYRLNLIHDKKFDWQTTWIGRPLPEASPGFWRTRRPLPEPPKLIPLEPSDVPPGSVFRGSGEIGYNGWCMIVSCSEAGVRYWRHCDPDNQSPVTWEELMRHGSQILRPGQTEWQPCSKPACTPS